MLQSIKTIGIIGLGEMGCLYAKLLLKAGFKVMGYDFKHVLIEKQKNAALKGITLVESGSKVCQQADLIIFSVPSGCLEDCLSQWGKYCHEDAIVCSQSSVKQLEINVFNKYINPAVEHVLQHALFGPFTNPKGQTIVAYPYRCSEGSYEKFKAVINHIGAHIYTFQNPEQHDIMVADTQAVTHFSLLCLGTAWKNQKQYPWETKSKKGIDYIKVLSTLRIYGLNPHVYSSIAIYNPFAIKQIEQYVKSETQIFKWMITHQNKALISRIDQASEFIFANRNEPLILSKEIIKKYNLDDENNSYSNSHLSILSMVDVWYTLKVNPYLHLICKTPPFKLRLGIAEYLFKTKKLLSNTLNYALNSPTIRAHDLEFHSAVREWGAIVGNASIKSFHQHFEKTRSFFKSRLIEGKTKSETLIKMLNN